MTGNDAKVLLDLNYPAFQAELLVLDVVEIKKIFKTLRKLRGMTWNEVFHDAGLKWEQPVSMSGKYTIRLSASYRAVVSPETNWVRFLSLHPDHDSAYGRK